MVPEQIVALVEPELGIVVCAIYIVVIENSNAVKVILNNVFILLQFCLGGAKVIIIGIKTQVLLDLLQLKIIR
ncbi:MAG: hypothetical protein ACO3EE_00285 [Flavobacteriales bacterium]